MHQIDFLQQLSWISRCSRPECRILPSPSALHCHFTPFAMMFFFFSHQGHVQPQCRKLHGSCPYSKKVLKLYLPHLPNMPSEWLHRLWCVWKAFIPKHVFSAIYFLWKNIADIYKKGGKLTLKIFIGIICGCLLHLQKTVFQMTWLPPKLKMSPCDDIIDKSSSINLR